MPEGGPYKTGTRFGPYLLEAYLGSGAVKNQKINSPNAGEKNKRQRPNDKTRLRTTKMHTKLPTKKSKSGKVKVNL